MHRHRIAVLLQKEQSTLYVNQKREKNCLQSQWFSEMKYTKYDEPMAIISKYSEL